MKSLMTSQKIFNMNIIAKNINFLSSPNPISGSTRMKVLLSNVNYVHRQHDGPLFSAPLCINGLIVVCYDPV